MRNPLSHQYNIDSVDDPSALDRPVLGSIAVEIGLQQLLTLFAHVPKTRFNPADVGVVVVAHDLGQLRLRQSKVLAGFSDLLSIHVCQCTTSVRSRKFRSFSH